MFRFFDKTNEKNIEALEQLNEKMAKILEDTAKFSEEHKASYEARLAAFNELEKQLLEEEKTDATKSVQLNITPKA